MRVSTVLPETGINQFIKGMGGPEYIASILTGYTGEEKEEAGTTFYENTAFPGGWIAMAPPLYGEGRGVCRWSLELATPRS